MVTNFDRTICIPPLPLHPASRILSFHLNSHLYSNPPILSCCPYPLPTLQCTRYQNCKWYCSAGKLLVSDFKATHKLAGGWRGKNLKDISLVYALTS